MLKRQDNSTKVIVVNRPRMDEKQIASAFAGNAASPWYLALVQILEQTRHDNALEASQYASKDNALGMAGSLNVYEAMSALLIDLDKMVNQSKG